MVDTIRTIRVQRFTLIAHMLKNREILWGNILSVCTPPRESITTENIKLYVPILLYQPPEIIFNVMLPCQE
jgi:hypothetical protein